MRPACALIYTMIARSFLRAKPSVGPRIKIHVLARLHVLAYRVFFFCFTQVRFAFLSSVTNEPMWRSRVRRSKLAVERRQRTNRCSRIDLLTRYAASYGNVTLARYCDTLATHLVINAKVETTFSPIHLSLESIS